MLMRLMKAGIVLAATAAFMPADHFGSMPGLDADAPAQFAVHGSRAMATLGMQREAACDARPDLCDGFSQAAAQVEDFATGSVQAVATDPISRQIALEAARSAVSTF